MGFFDLKIPYDDSSPANKTIRMKLVVKAMELGYSGIAYERTMKGVMSEKDRCSIPLLTLSSLLKLAPSLSSSVEFHRDLLGVSRVAPFRQYTRLTVCVESPAQALALNLGNPVLKTYNLVSARPLNQSAFDQACEKSEVDIIAIDFSEKLPFRLKQHMIKTAIERGVYFEITYSNLIADAYLRRQLISNSKLLVDWTRGKNLIISSAASSVNELRGPYDVANLSSSLLGLSMERAKAALSKNCRTLIANVLKKKQFFKEAIKVEMTSSGEIFDSKKPWTVDWLKWDPISSGEGDLQLDDMAKSFAASTNEPKIVKAIDFGSIVDTKPSNSFRVTDLISGSETTSLFSNYNKDISAPDKIVEVQVATNSLLQQTEKLNQYPESKPCSFSDAPPKDQNFHGEIIQKFNTSDTMKELSNADDVVSIMEQEIRSPKTCHGKEVNAEVVSNSCSGLNTPVNLQLSNVDTVTRSISSENTDFSSGVEGYGGASNSNGDSLITLDDVAMQEDSLEEEKFMKHESESLIMQENLTKVLEKSTEPMDQESYLRSCDASKVEEGGSSIANQQPSASGKCRGKRRTTSRAVMFPWKRMLNHVAFKKGHTSKRNQ